MTCDQIRLGSQAVDMRLMKAKSFLSGQSGITMLSSFTMFVAKTNKAVEAQKAVSQSVALKQPNGHSGYLEFI